MDFLVEDAAVQSSIFASRLVSTSYMMNRDDRCMLAKQGQGNARLFNRLRTHRRDGLAHRWHYFSWFGLLAVNKSGHLSGWDAPTKRVSGTRKSTLNEIEGVLIAATEPAFNKQGAKFKGIARYHQVNHRDAEYTSLAQLRQMLNKLGKKIDDWSEDD